MPVEGGFVPTPPAVADFAAREVFGTTKPSEGRSGGRLLLPGIGTGNLLEAVQRYCTAGEGWRVADRDYAPPKCVGVELDSDRLATVRQQQETGHLDLVEADFLRSPPPGPFDWVLCNPPYTRYDRLDPDDRAAYRTRFGLSGQFPLYVPFVLQAFRLLRSGGTMTCILPIQALLRDHAEPLRMVVRRHFAGLIAYLPPQTFDQAVETILLTVEKQSAPSVDGYTGLWLEPLLPYGIEPLLRRLDVDDLDEGHDLYRARLCEYQQRVRRFDRWTTVDATGESSALSADDHEQTDLTAWN